MAEKVSTVEMIKRRRSLMEDAAVLEGEGPATDEATKDWRHLSVDGATGNQKTTYDNPDEKPILRK